MIFSSTLFIFAFLPALIFVYYVLPAGWTGVGNFVLLAASLFFYAWGEPVVIAIMLVSIFVNYVCGLLLGSGMRKGKKGQGILLLAVVFNLGLLGYYKYVNFVVENVNALTNLNLPSPNVGLPIGISFFTFQILSYTIDVYRQKVAPQKNIFSLALYISFFPQLIAGPIVRYADIEKQISHREHSVRKFAQGAQRFIMGLSKKVLVANTAAVFADAAFARQNLTAPMAWVGVIAYAIQIYFDFSGYSDMAIGLGRMFGFTFLENFNYPYISTSVQEFWRRWHMSLSSWFRDYLYIPLGGNRKGAARTYFNLLIVFFATGLWHGASWSFVVWGLFHGFFLIVERAFLGKVLAKMPAAIGWAYTIVAVLFGWVIFRADTLSDAWRYMQAMFTGGPGAFNPLLVIMNFRVAVALAVGIAGSAPLAPWLRKTLLNGHGPMSPELAGGGQRLTAVASMILSLGLFVLSVIFLTGSDFNPFLYFRF